jgi:5-methylcytosine-specific restriction endonuclease McrA
MQKRNAARAKRFRSAISRAKPACHICGLPILWDADHRDPKSFVIDHVIPLHKGGADELHNIKAAHRDCNSKKRARIVAPIIRRSGSLD